MYEKQAMGAKQDSKLSQFLLHSSPLCIQNLSGQKSQVSQSSDEAGALYIPCCVLLLSVYVTIYKTLEAAQGTHGGKRVSKLGV